MKLQIELKYDVQTLEHCKQKKEIDFIIEDFLNWLSSDNDTKFSLHNLSTFIREYLLDHSFDIPEIKDNQILHYDSIHVTNIDSIIDQCQHLLIK